MAVLDRMLGAVEQIHTAGLDPAAWPAALAAISEIAGGVGCVLELFDLRDQQLLTFVSHGVAPALELAYLDHYTEVSPRIARCLGSSAGSLLWDYQILEEAQIDRSEFYVDFLEPQDMRYFLGGVLTTEPGKFGSVTLQYSPRHGHVGESEISLMAQLTPHVSQAFEVNGRLAGHAAQANALLDAMDWLTEGAALLDADGRVLRANAAFAGMDVADDGLRLREGRIAFALPAAERAFQRALAVVRRLQGGELQGPARDFTASRPSGAPAYRVSIRPLLSGFETGVGAVFLVLVRDPAPAGSLGEQALREAFGLTPAEAHLALELCAGVSPGVYAVSRNISPNTVYAHLRRLKEKCATGRTVELIAALNAARGGPPGAI